MEPFEAVILIAAGFAAGFINTLAGGGSAITIPILTEIVGVNVANGTNRIAILVANIGAIAGFQRGRAIPWERMPRLVTPAVIGAVMGAWVATGVSAGAMRRVFASVILLIAISAIYRPSRWLENRQQSLREPWSSLVFLAIGFYGGFVQAGVGLLLLTGLVFGGGLDLVKGNAAKVVIVAAYTPVALLIFASAAQVDVAVGAVLATGQVGGAYTASRLAVSKGAGWVRWVLVVAAVAAAVRLGFF